MKAAQKIHFFSYKSAFLFFSFILALNLVVNPLLTGFGVNETLSLFLINTVGISVGLVFVLVWVEGKFKQKKKAGILLLSLLILSGSVCFSILYG
ncbi:hypothetical protein [Exiguobacterium sp. s189]|uniref:hypothetical protein n=1 Tax=Exiguobacterium sp. s189 TaxID=2751263 RepID=UPI001BE7B65E|nr:hypothetical protein [Exiguobacterium sp. s189]